MAAPGVGLGAGGPSFLQFHHEFNNSNHVNNPLYYHHEYTNTPHYYPPPQTATAPPHFMAPAAAPPPPIAPLYNNNNKKVNNLRNQGGGGRVRTLFISGLPEDVKPREIYNLFRRRPGFDTCQLKYTGRGYQIVAFAVFSHQQYALAAKDALNGLTFDPETGATLHIELARANSRIKRSDDVSHGPYDKKIRGPIGAPGIYDDDDTGTDENEKMQGSSDITQSGGETGASIGGQDGKSSPIKRQPPGQGSNLPCPTLFIANLGPTCSEGELGYVLARFKGFKMLKMQTKGGMPVAFVDFEDVTYSTEALKQLQDTLLPSSDRGGMHLEYAKSRMRYPRQDKLVENEIK